MWVHNVRYHFPLFGGLQTLPFFTQMLNFSFLYYFLFRLYLSISLCLLPSSPPTISCFIFGPASLLFSVFCYLQICSSHSISFSFYLLYLIFLLSLFYIYRCLFIPFYSFFLRFISYLPFFRSFLTSISF
jgi:hypothetical protein